jgi:hypothetical protein
MTLFWVIFLAIFKKFWAKFGLDLGKTPAQQITTDNNRME